MPVRIKGRRDRWTRVGETFLELSALGSCVTKIILKVPQNGEQEEEGMLWYARDQGVSQRCISLLAFVLAPAGAPAVGSASEGKACWGEARLFPQHQLCSCSWHEHEGARTSRYRAPACSGSALFSLPRDQPRGEKKRCASLWIVAGSSFVASSSHLLLPAYKAG